MEQLGEPHLGQGLHDLSAMTWVRYAWASLDAWIAFELLGFVRFSALMNLAVFSESPAWFAAWVSGRAPDKQRTWDDHSTTPNPNPTPARIGDPVVEIGP